MISTHNNKKQIQVWPLAGGLKSGEEIFQTFFLVQPQDSSAQLGEGHTEARVWERQFRFSENKTKPENRALSLDS